MFNYEGECFECGESKSTPTSRLFISMHECDGCGEKFCLRHIHTITKLCEDFIISPNVSRSNYSYHVSRTSCSKCHKEKFKDYKVFNAKTDSN